MEKKGSNPRGDKERQPGKSRPKKEGERHLESGDNPDERKKMSGKK